MPRLRSNTMRRREIRKSIPRERRSLRDILGRSQVVIGLLLATVFVALAAVIVIQSRSQPAYRPGQLVDQPQLARVSFTAVDPTATARAREDASRKTPAVYTANSTFFEATRKGLSALPGNVANAESVADVAEELRRKFGLSGPQEPALQALKQFQVDGNASGRWQRMVDQLLEDLRFTAILRPEQYQIEQDNLAPAIRLKLSEQRSTLVYESQLVNLKDRQDLTETIGGLIADFPEAIQPILKHYFVMADQPTYTKNNQLTTRAARAAEADVQPVEVQYRSGQVLVPAGTRLDQDQYRLLVEHRAALPAKSRWMARSGLIVLIILLTAGFVSSVLWLRPRIAENPMRGLALAGLLLLTLTLAWVAGSMSPFGVAGGPAAAVGTAMLTAVILTVAYDRWLALSVAALHAVLIGLALDLSVGLYLATLATCTVASMQLRELRHRGTLIRMSIISALVAAAGVLGAELSEKQLIDGIDRAIGIEVALSAISAVSVGFFVLGILPFIERAFKVTTSMTLIELCDINQPLLRRLAQAAPGTYNHSLQVGTLADAAAESIGANRLLARVAAYYHDIGKINKPQYFVENQSAGMNPHDRVSPAMSLLIIVGHVKDGVEMAREYGLPPVLHHFIESHHGTTLVEFFYHEARRRKAEQEPVPRKQRVSAAQPEEVEYRYPGPKPHTKEAAILMLCDAVESASRSLPELTATRIEQLVHTLTSRRLLDGQFDHCDITLGELRRVETAIARSLSAVHHGRVSYPVSPTARGQQKKPAAAG